MPDLQAKRCFRLHQAFARLQPNRQPETFAKPKNAQETVNSPSFPRRRESWLSLCNKLFLRRFLNIKQDSRLRGNDGIFYFSGCCWGFCKGFSLKFNLSSKKIVWLNPNGFVFQAVLGLDDCWIDDVELFFRLPLVIRKHSKAA